MIVAAQLQSNLDAVIASQKSAREAAQTYLTQGKALCIGGDTVAFHEAKIAFEKGLAEKPSDPELVDRLKAAIAQFTSEDESDADEEKQTRLAEDLVEKPEGRP